MSEGYHVKFSNQATKKVFGVLFASDSNSQDSLCSAWMVFKERQSTVVIPAGLSIEFHYSLNGERYRTGLYSCEQDKVWRLSVKNDNVELSPESQTGIVILMCMFMLEKLLIQLYYGDKLNKRFHDSQHHDDMSTSQITVYSSIPNAWEGNDFYVNLYKGNHLFIVKQFTGGESLNISEYSPLYFGLTSHDLNPGDVFTNRNMFSPLAKIDLSYYNTGMDIQITDNPAGRPHVVMNKI